MANANGTGKWLYWARHNADAPRRLFCFPYAGAGTTAFAGWTERLKTNLDVSIVVPPGREARYAERALSRLEPLVQGVVDALGGHLDRPYLLFGHSFGALIAFEVARALRRLGAPPPDRLFVSGAPAPHCGWPHRGLHAMDDAHLLTELRRFYEGIPQPVLDDPELRGIVLPTLRADLAVVETYQYRDEASLNCPISAFSGRDDHAIETRLVQAWKHQTTSDFQHREIRGDHFFLRGARDAVIAGVLADLPAAASEGVAGLAAV